MVRTVTNRAVTKQRGAIQGDDDILRPFRHTELVDLFDERRPGVCVRFYLKADQRAA